MRWSFRGKDAGSPDAGAVLLGRAGAILVGISSLGVVVFGVWLAI